jgi:DegV family protein with EDD domain
MSLRILTDSSSDLPDEMAQAAGVHVLPLFININGTSYRDGLDLSRAEFYQRLPTLNSPATTAAPGIEVFKKHYERLLAEGAGEILSIHVSNRLSSVADMARSAAAEFRRGVVTVLDAGQLSLGTGFAALEAARAAAAGHSLAEVVSLVEDQLARTYTVAALDTFTYLRRSGRVNGLVATLGSLLQIKPLMKMHRGIPNAERARTTSGALNRLNELLTALAPLERGAILHANARHRAETFLRRMRALLPGVEIPLVEISPVIGTHIGPGAVGFVCVAQPKNGDVK